MHASLKAPKSTRGSSWREFELIEAIRQVVGKPGRRDCLGIGDDASAHRPEPGMLELVTCDALVEGVHWEFAWCDAQTLGYRTAAVNLSDIAAMGGTPRRAHLALALPKNIAVAKVVGFVRSLSAALKSQGVYLAGGDTNASPGPMMVSLTVQGVVKPTEMLCRSGARPGDWLLVTGDLGSAGAGLWELQHAHAPQRLKTYTSERWRHPQPRLAEGRLLAQSRRVHALMDLSDGLAGDLRRMCAASGVGARIHAAHLPLAVATQRVAEARRQPAWSLALRSGEDYELLFAVPPAAAPALVGQIERRLGTSCSLVGEILPASQGVSLVLPSGKITALPPGWEHNRAERS